MQHVCFCSHFPQAELKHLNLLLTSTVSKQAWCCAGHSSSMCTFILKETFLDQTVDSPTCAAWHSVKNPEFIHEEPDDIEGDWSRLQERGQWARRWTSPRRLSRFVQKFFPTRGSQSLGDQAGGLRTRVFYFALARRRGSATVFTSTWMLWRVDFYCETPCLISTLIRHTSPVGLCLIWIFNLLIQIQKKCFCTLLP